LIKLTENQRYKLGDNDIYWLYLGTGEFFDCSSCGKTRNKVYEFIGYKNLDTLLLEQKAGKYNGWNYHECYGSECIKRIKITPV
jgi:hypothetical protein